MALPGLTETVKDTGLGLISGNPESTPILLGCCTAGTPNALYSLGDISTIQSQLGAGKLAELAAYVLDVSGGPLYCMPLNPSQVGALGAVTHSGTGVGTCAVFAAPHQAITFTIVGGGVLGAATYTVQVGSGAVSSVKTLPANGIVAVAGTYCTVTFAAGTYVANDTYVIGTDGIVNHTGTGVPANPTQVSSPLDDYVVLVTITKDGANGTAQFTYSLDNGNVTSSIVVSAANGVYAIPASGIVLTLGGTQTARDVFSFDSAAPSFNASDLSTATGDLQTTYLQQASYSLAHVERYAQSASAAATEASTLQTTATALFNLGVYSRWFMSAPSVGTVYSASGILTVDSADNDSVTETAFQSVVADKVVVGAGDALVTSAISGLSLRRSASWVAIARACEFEASANIGEFDNGGVASVTKLYRDENATPGLDAARFVTLRSFPGEPGLYLTDGHTMDLVTGDQSDLANARVLDRACLITRQAGTPLTNKKVETSRKTPGAISERAAQRIESGLSAKLNTALVDTQPQDAVAAKATVNRTNNVLSSKQILITVAVQPYAYAKYISATIGLTASV